MTARPMTTMLWKELRENAKWAALAAALVVAALGVVGYLARWTLRGDAEVHTLLQPVWAFTVGTFALAGVILGLMQSVPESPRDRWALLVHRPLSRGRVFAAKVQAGLLLYLAATCVPVLLAATWLLTVGWPAVPLGPRLLLGVGVDLLAGMVYYFAALTIGLRQARWFGSRLLPAAVPVWCTILSVGLPWPWAIAITLALGLSVMATAAWGTFRAGGTYEPQPRAAKVALGACLFAGAASCVAMGLAAFSSLTWRQQSFRQDSWSYDVTGPGGGRFLHVVHEHDPDRAWEPMRQSVTDESGNPVPGLANLIGIQMTATATTQPTSLPFNAYLLADASRTWQYDYRPRGWASTGKLVASNEFEQWYYAYADRLVRGYERKTGRPIGWIGPDGFEAGPAKPAERFPTGRPFGNVTRWGLLVFPDHVYHVDAFNRTATSVFRAAPGERLLDAASDQPANAPLGRVAVSSSDAIHLLNRGKLVVSSQMVRPNGSYAQLIQPNEESSDILVWFSAEPVARYRGGAYDLVRTYAPDGTFKGERRLPLEKLVIQRGPRWRDAVEGAFLPPALWGGAWAVQKAWPGGSEGNVVDDADSDNEVLPMTASLFAALLSAGVTVLAGHRYAWPRRRLAGWAAANFLLGPVAVLTMLCLLEWPPRVRCPSCGRPRVASRERCEHCDAPFSAPPRNGTEIFEPATMAA